MIIIIMYGCRSTPEARSDMEKKNVILIALVVILAIVIIANVVIALVVNNTDDGALTDADRLNKYLSKQGFGDMPLTSRSETESYLRKSGFSKKASEEDYTEYYRKTISDNQASVIVIKDFESEDKAKAYYELCTDDATGKLFKSEDAFVYEERSAGVKTSGSFLLKGSSVYSTKYYVKDSSISTIRNLSATTYDRGGIAEYLVKHGYVLIESTDEYDVYNKDYGEYLPNVSEITVYKDKEEDYYNELKYASASYKMSEYPDFNIVGNVSRDKLFVDLGGNGCALISSVTENVVISEEIGFNRTSTDILKWLGLNDFSANSVEAVKEYAVRKGCTLDNSYTETDGRVVSIYSDTFEGLYTFSADDGMSEFLSGYGGENVLSSREAEIAEYDSASSAESALNAITLCADETRYEVTLNGKSAIYREYIDDNDDYVNGELIFTVDNAVVSLKYKTLSAERADLMRSVSGVDNLDYTKDGFVASLGSGFSVVETTREYLTDGGSTCSLDVKAAQAVSSSTLEVIAVYLEDSSAADELYADIIAAYKDYVEASSLFDSINASERNSYYYIKGADVEPELFAMHVKDGSEHVILLMGYITGVQDILSGVL